MLAELTLAKLATDAVHVAVAFDAKEVVAARGRKRLEQRTDGGRLQVGARRKDARDDSILRGIDDDPLPRFHVPGTEGERSEDGDVEGHAARLSTTAAARWAPKSPRSRSVGPARTLWGLTTTPSPDVLDTA